MVLCIISFTHKKLRSVQKNPVGQEAAEAGLDGFVYSLVSCSSLTVWPYACHQTNLQQAIALMGRWLGDFSCTP